MSDVTTPEGRDALRALAYTCLARQPAYHWPFVAASVGHKTAAALVEALTPEAVVALLDRIATLESELNARADLLSIVRSDVAALLARLEPDAPAQDHCAGCGKVTPHLLRGLCVACRA